MIRETEGGVTSPKGYRAAGTEARIKYQDRKDMALIYTESPAVCAGVFTKNVVKAAPVQWDRLVVKAGGDVHAIVVNSGIANACTGAEGKNACRDTAKAVAEALAIPAESVLVSSTGVIGMQLPMERITAGVEKLAGMLQDSRQAAADAAGAIITTDTYAKEAAVSFEIGGKTCTMGAMAKGSGMIHPNMGTMLAFVTTDAAISKPLLQKAVSDVVQDTFNMISVDGDTSTNDTLLVLANGRAENPEITEENGDYRIFREALLAVCTRLARMLAGDGEGATALFTAHVTGADTKEHARTLAKSVICSSLTKAAIFGHDANWGRILCALGYAGVDFDPEKITLSISDGKNTMLIFADGKAADYSEEEATAILSAPEVIALADMRMGTEEAFAYGCDLSYDYVKINADYRS